MYRPARCAPMLRATAAGLTLTIAVLSGCGLGDDKKGQNGARGASPTQRYTGPLAKEAWSMLGGTHARIEVKRVERFADRSVLRFYLTNLEKQPNSFSFGTSAYSMGFDEILFNLVDPVGRRLYHPLWDQGGDGDMVGSAT